MVIFKATRWLTPSCLGALAGVGAALLFANHAAAEACDEHGGCPHGFVCSTHEDKACPAIACASDDPDCAKDSVCETRNVSECAPATCASNDDCASDMVCFEERHDACDQPVAQSCKQGEECAAPSEPPKCEPETRSSCTPRYVPPCVKDADCGPGFSCTEIVEHSCSGSAGRAPSPGVGTGGSGGSSGGASDAGQSDGAGGSDGGEAKDFAPSEPSCTSRATGEFRCELQRIDCESVKDCPDGFSCEELRSGVACNSTDVARGAPGAAPSPPDAGGAGGAGGNAENGGSGSSQDDQADPPSQDAAAVPPDTSCADAPPVTSEKVCLPPYAREQLGRGGLHGDDTSLPELDQASTTSAGAKDAAEMGGEDPPNGETSMAVCSVSTPGSGAGNLLGLLGTLGIAAVVIARRGARRG